VDDETLELIKAKFNKEYGEGVFADASSMADVEEEILPTTPLLDIALSGGVPGGSWVTLTGAPKTGKSQLALTMAAAAQAQGRFVVYADVEARLKRKNLRIDGLDWLDPKKFYRLRSTKKKLLGGADFLNQILYLLETVPRIFVIIDSVSALAERKELAEGVEAETRGNINKRISSFCRIAGQAVTVNDAIVIGMTHRYANTSGFGAPEMEKAGYAWKHQRDVCLKIKKSELWSVADTRTIDGQRQLGKKVTWVAEESALGPPGCEVTTYLRYNHGYDKEYEFYELAKSYGFIEKAEKGGMVYFSFVGGKKVPSFRGDERAFAALKGDPDAFTTIRKLVLGKLTPGGDDE
jgi:RecA/RadA recombinase